MGNSESSPRGEKARHVGERVNKGSSIPGQQSNAKKDMMSMDDVESMMKMFAAAMEAKNSKAQELEVVAATAQKELAIAKDKEYDEKFLLDELQKLLKTNADLLQAKQALESENKAIMQEGDLLAQQLESMTFYMKNLAV
eukprot:CAMPEP_0118949396 /NCGR_PEP_ID=MMETSP1169-20130426/49541_1 /TAXON_ID=36882 /ORGANISM="Pyramimonas obovata, Strain CCMP722" /LENGTH=139 /DNA_ID=CAMNT_0006896017 /DNA_START=358 /DNA_END=773 /DNA_ORIENTATION=+